MLNTKNTKKLRNYKTPKKTKIQKKQKNTKIQKDLYSFLTFSHLKCPF